MMDSPGQRTLRIANDLSALFLTLSIYGAYVDGGLLALIWKLCVMWIVQRAFASIAKKGHHLSGSVNRAAPTMLVDIDEFFGSLYVAPAEHATTGSRVCRAVALMGLPLMMHAFVFLGFPLHNGNAFPSVGGILTNFEYAALQQALDDAGDMPAAVLRWNSLTQSTKFWTFTAAPELASLSTYLWLDVTSIFVLYVILTLMVAAAGGSLPQHGFVQLLPLREASDMRHSSPTSSAPSSTR